MCRSLLVEMAKVCAKDGNVEFARVFFTFGLSEVVRDCLRDFATLLLPFMVLLQSRTPLSCALVTFSCVVLFYLCEVGNVDELCE